MLSADFVEVSPGLYIKGDEIARGGLGRILEAYDRRLNRRVALKELIPRDERAEARFIREALITARLEHPNIVTVHEAGRWPTGQRFYAMKLVEGQTLSELLDHADDEKRLSLLPAVIDVCDAVAYAHSQGILHRDLKPANVMVGPFNETVLLDWGLAKDLNADEDPTVPIDPASPSPDVFMTNDGMVVGTPPYMPPEQALAQELDERSDVYALGAMIYQVLSGRRPYQDVTPDRILAEVAAHPPTPLSDLAPDAPPALVAIVEKAMARKPEKRFPSAAELAKELRRYTAGKLVAAYDYSPLQIVRHYMARQRAAVFVGALAILGFAAFGAWSFARITIERNEAAEAAALAEARVDELTLEKARSLLDTDPTAALAWLEKLSKPLRGASSVAAEAESRGVARHVFEGHDDVINAVVFSPDGRQIASASTDETIRIWNVETGTSKKLEGHTDRVASIAFSQDGRSIASGGYDRTVRLWDVDGGGSRVIAEHGASVKRVAFAPDGASIASIGEDRVLRLTPVGGGEAKKFEVPTVNREVTIEFSFDGSKIATGGHGNAVYVFDVAIGSRERFAEQAAPVKWVTWSPSGERLACAGADGTVMIVELATKSTRVYAVHEDIVQHVAFSPDGKRIASASLDHTVRVVEIANGRTTTLSGHSERVSTVAFTPDGKRVVSGGWDRTVRVWDLDANESTVLLGHGDVVSALAVARDGRWVATASWDQTVRYWPTDPGYRRVLVGHEIGVHGVDLSSDGTRVASGGHDNEVRVWDLVDQSVRVLDGHTDHIFRVQFSPDDRWIASTADDRTVRLWPTAGGAAKILEGHEQDVEEIAFSADSKWLASASEDDTAWLWNVESAKGRKLAGHEDDVTFVTFAPNGERIATASRDGTVRLWTPTGDPERSLTLDTGEVWGVSFAPKGDRLAAASSNGTLYVFDAATGERKWRRDGLEGARLVLWSPDERFIAVTTFGETVYLCRPSFDLCDRLSGHRSIVWDLEFEPRSRALVTGSGDHTVRIWDVETGESRVLRGHHAPVFDIALSDDGARIASASADRRVRLWGLELPPHPDALAEWIQRVTSATSNK